MSDVLAVIAVLLFFGLTGALASLFDRLQGGGRK
jgi:hypothetical protein